LHDTKHDLRELNNLAFGELRALQIAEVLGTPRWYLDVSWKGIEIWQCQANGIDYFAFWNESEEAFGLFEKYGMSPQTRETCPPPKADTQKEQIVAAAEFMLPSVKRTRKLGS
tara:strand:- start:1529 stop:1867 length:339 start_codon:yes stop_codon:yes gene_type:complete